MRITLDGRTFYLRYSPKYKAWNVRPTAKSGTPTCVISIYENTYNKVFNVDTYLADWGGSFLSARNALHLASKMVSEFYGYDHHATTR